VAANLIGYVYEQANTDDENKCERDIEIWQFCIFTWKCIHKTNYQLAASLNL
jgi:hypothetical protein